MHKYFALSNNRSLILSFLTLHSMYFLYNDYMFLKAHLATLRFKRQPSYTFETLTPSSSTQHQVYHSLDVTKLFCAFLIVYMHSYFSDLGTISKWFRDVITNTGVPFFFITSGFFFMKGLMKNSHSIEYLRRYAWRIGKMYLAWSIITLPVSWLCIEWGHPDYSTPLKIVYLFRMFFFSGSCGIYWYLLALFVCCFIIYYFSVKKKLICLYLIATFLFIIGVIYNSPYNNGNICFRLIHIVFGSERNFFNVGFSICAQVLFTPHTTSDVPIQFG